MKATQTNLAIKTLCSVAAIVATVMITQIAPAALVNGDFETGVPYPAAIGRFNIFSSGAPTPWSAPPLISPDCYANVSANINDGWPLTGIPAYGNMFQNMLAASGNRFMGMAAGVGPNGGTFFESIRQTTPPLIGGQTYTISAALAAEDTGKAPPQYGGPYTGRGKVDVYLDNAYIGTLAPNTASLTWQQRSFSFVAPNTSTAVFDFRVAFANASAPVPSYVGIDNITLVPEPGACLLTTTGLALCSFRRRRSA